MLDLDSRLGKAYRYWRQYHLDGGQPLPAGRALEMAKSEIAIGAAERYPAPGFASFGNIGAPFDSAGTQLRWIENPESAGLRLVGFADEIAKTICGGRSRGLDHTGWYQDSDGDGFNGLLRGVVYRLPHTRAFVIGYAQVDYNGKPTEPGAVLALNSADLWDVSVDSDGNPSDLGVAYAADKIAERAAEKEREYQDAWRLGSDYASHDEAAIYARHDVLKLCRERRAALASVPSTAEFTTLCGTVTSRVSDLVATIYESRAKRDAILDDMSAWFAREYASAFNDGAGRPILPTGAA